VLPERWSNTLQQLSTRERKRRAEQSERDRILRDQEVGNRTGLSRTTRWRLIRDGKFPKPIKLTEHAIGWRESAIEAWLESREAA
jgi:prophage regulatory protein